MARGAIPAIRLIPKELSSSFSALVAFLWSVRRASETISGSSLCFGNPSNEQDLLWAADRKSVASTGWQIKRKQQEGSHRQLIGEFPIENGKRCS